MSLRRYARKADTATQQIVDELRALHFTVEHLGQPIDLAVRHSAWPPGMFLFVEVKSSRKKNGDVKLDARQTKQHEFCEAHGVLYATCTEDVLARVGMRSRGLPDDFEVRGIYR